MNWTLSTLKTIVHQKTLSRQCNNNPQNETKNLQIIYLTRDLFPYQNILKTPTTHQQKTTGLQNGQRA